MGKKLGFQWPSFLNICLYVSVSVVQKSTCLLSAKGWGPEGPETSKIGYISLKRGSILYSFYSSQVIDCISMQVAESESEVKWCES